MKKIYLYIVVAIVTQFSNHAQCNQNPGNNTGDLGCVTFTYNSTATSYTTVRAADGNIWLQQNLGSASVATSSADVNALGDLFQWGRWDDGHQLRTAPTGSAPATNNPSGITVGDSNFYLTQWWVGFQTTDKWEAATPAAATAENGCDPCKAIGNGWRLPTNEEWSDIITAENISSPATALNSNLKLALTGNRDGSGTFNFKGSRGYYWSSTTSSSGAKYLYFSSVITNASAGGPRGQGSAVRCLKAAGSLGLNEYGKSLFNIYPNPTDNIFTVQSEEAMKEIAVFDVLGKPIIKTTFKEVDLSALNEGIYFVQVFFEDNKTATQKIVKR